MQEKLPFAPSMHSGTWFITEDASGRPTAATMQLQSLQRLAARAPAVLPRLHNALLSNLLHPSLLHQPGLQAAQAACPPPHRVAHQPGGPVATASSSSSSSVATASSSGRSRAYPDEPRVGVGVVVFRKPITAAGESPEILLIRRAKEPAKGQWCFPGGSLELGENIASCAVREVLEETGLHIRHNPDAVVEGFSKQLQQPIPFAAVDSIVRDAAGQLQFHYVVVEAAAMASDPDATPVASDDVDGVQWVQVAKLRQLENLTKNCSRIAEEAVERFDLSC